MYNANFNKLVENKFYIFKAGWEFQKDRLLNYSPDCILEYIYIFDTRKEYAENMRIHIWDFIVRYCQKFLRLTINYMTILDDYLK